MPRLEVLVKTEAMTGKTSVLSVGKSRVGRIAGRVRRARSWSEGVGDSRERW